MPIGKATILAATARSATIQPVTLMVTIPPNSLILTLQPSLPEVVLPTRDIAAVALNVSPVVNALKRWRASVEPADMGIVRSANTEVANPEDANAQKSHLNEVLVDAANHTDTQKLRASVAMPHPEAIPLMVLTIYAIDIINALTADPATAAMH
eukprot:Gregarina_sp_Poly_1__4336@NODE_234_length_11010_cov_523_298456_g207_i0_p7_GENE_NODE_234_length_11010_cov_523_298456_g207_i0NODE_234_length_11010_cov_523_298456_g207_i0_p7_ORF_typecomplete_len154_score22_78LRRC37/PF15779_5/19LRRC37/PF15779_5/43_NODE_234_length_11010_cov_523_298456_g207_i022662727